MKMVPYRRHEEDLGPRHWRLHRPIAHFFGWWVSVFALTGPFAVCPFCGQPGCGMGAAVAIGLGGIVAAVMTFPEYLKRRIVRRRLGQLGRTS
jgi:hypothetical protein